MRVTIDQIKAEKMQMEIRRKKAINAMEKKPMNKSIKNKKKK